MVSGKASLAVFEHCGDDGILLVGQRPPEQVQKAVRGPATGIRRCGAPPRASAWSKVRAATSIGFLDPVHDDNQLYRRLQKALPAPGV